MRRNDLRRSELGNNEEISYSKSQTCPDYNQRVQNSNRLIVAAGTVKKHLNNIYGKLRVNNRMSALAREVGLLEYMKLESGNYLYSDLNNG